MRHQHGAAAGLLLVLLLFLPPILNVCFEFYTVKTAERPPVHSFGFGSPGDTHSLKIPAEYRKGTYVPAKVLGFNTPAPFRSSYFAAFSPEAADNVLPGATVIARPWMLAGIVVKVWRKSGFALVKSLRDPSFRAACVLDGKKVIVRGQGGGAELVLESGAHEAAAGAIAATSGEGNVFPPGLHVGYSTGKETGIIVPFFTRKQNAWVHLWIDPDLQRIQERIQRTLR